MNNLITWLSLLIAAGALLYTWWQSRTIDTINRRLDRYNKALFDVGDEMRELSEKLENTTAQLRIEIKKNSGKSIFTPEMSVKEAQMAHPQAQQVMERLHLGGCSSCAEDSLLKASRDHGVDTQLLLTSLNKLANGEPLKLMDLPQLPNVQLEIE